MAHGIPIVRGRREAANRPIHTGNLNQMYELIDLDRGAGAYADGGVAGLNMPTPPCAGQADPTAQEDTGRHSCRNILTGRFRLLALWLRL